MHCKEKNTIAWRVNRLFGSGVLLLLMFCVASITAINVAHADDALSNNVLAAMLMYWKDAAMLVLFLATVMFWWTARRLLHQQQETHDNALRTHEKQQDEHFLRFAEKLKVLDVRFQGEIESFAAATTNRSLSGEKLLRTQEHALKKSMNELQQHADEIGQTTQTLRAALDSKDEEIRRLKEGHDAVVWAKFVRRFIRVHQYVDDLLAETEGASYLQKIKLRLDGAIEECGVEAFAPQIGSRYDEQLEGALDDSPEEVPCVAIDDEFKIVGIIQRGYRLCDSGKIIAPAKVKIYAAARPRVRDKKTDVANSEGRV